MGLDISESIRAIVMTTKLRLHQVVDIDAKIGSHNTMAIYIT
jgi:hypothetical protein